jgi:hypothetical protein
MFESEARIFAELAGVAFYVGGVNNTIFQLRHGDALKKEIGIALPYKPTEAAVIAAELNLAYWAGRNASRPGKFCGGNHGGKGKVEHVSPDDPTSVSVLKLNDNYLACKVAERLNAAYKEGEANPV